MLSLHSRAVKLPLAESQAKEHYVVLRGVEKRRPFSRDSMPHSILAHRSIRPVFIDPAIKYRPASSVH